MNEQLNPNPNPKKTDFTIYLLMRKLRTERNVFARPENRSEYGNGYIAGLHRAIDLIEKYL